jgi:outer membrane translocation and assembly module TamA
MAWRFPYKDSVSGGVLDDLVFDTAIPISERFFAGGDTTIRGFALDRLGAPIDQVGGTVDEAGFPQGGHAVFILNGEFRVRLTRSIGFVTFLDVGNVFHRVSHLDVRRLRAGTGFGIRYASPLGPIRVDLGFKLGERHKFGCGETLGKECLTAVHISIGQAF